MSTTSGNGPSIRRVLSRLLPATILLALVVPAVAWAQSEFGIAPGSFTVRAENPDGTIDQLAGSHPYAYTVTFSLNKDAEDNVKGGNPRDVIADLPPGLFGNPLAAPRCTRAQFEGTFSNCPAETAVGVVNATFAGGSLQVTLPLYNLVPPKGFAAQLGTSGVGLNVLESASVNSEHGYRIEVGDYGLPTPIGSISETIWGVPAEESHDVERTLEAIDQQEPPVHSNAPHIPFLTLPDACGAPLQTTVRADSQLAPGVFAEESLLSTDSAGNPAALVGCENVPFAPLVGAVPTSSSADSASGLDFHLQLPNNGLLSPEGIMEAEPVKTEVTLPAGFVANPAAANGLGACSEEQFKHATAESSGCPASSKLGTLLARTPLLEEAIEGSVYLAAPHANPFGSLLALYIVARAPERGVLIKQAGEVRADPSTGQLTAIFDHLPPLPYSSFEFDLREGPRAPLITPSACGAYTLQAKLYPFSAPGTAVGRSAPFTIGTGAGGGACPASEAREPNAPSLQAGTVSPVAGAFSPFVFTIAREDGTQRLGAINATLPEGLLGRLAGVQYCSEAQIAAASARSGEGEGALEQSSPSCPEASQVGVVNITAGAGSQPYAVQGKAYLAGPYKDAPLSLAVITPAIAGPFDLGTVVVRVALYVDPNTSQIHAVSDPIPTILDGIPLDVRSVSLSMDRAGFTFNPTSCELLSVGGEAISTLGQSAMLSSRFQVGGCQGLPFKPTMTISTQGKTSKANGASLTVKVAQKPGEANIHKVDLTLPKILPARLTTLQQACTEAQFAANPAGCPQGSFIGTAKAITPVLNIPLTGPAILVSHGGAAFPDVVFLLQANERGSDIRIDLDGKTDIKKGITYSRFETVPDAPISSFETNLPEGPRSVLAANGNLCASKPTIPTALTGQNGAQVNQNTAVTVTGCPKTKALTRAQKLALALKACHKKPKGSKRQACEHQARKKYGPTKKAKKK